MHVCYVDEKKNLVFEGYEIDDVLGSIEDDLDISIEEFNNFLRFEGQCFRMQNSTSYFYNKGEIETLIVTLQEMHARMQETHLGPSQCEDVKEFLAEAYGENYVRLSRI